MAWRSKIGRSLATTRLYGEVPPTISTVSAGVSVAVRDGMSSGRIFGGGKQRLNVCSSEYGLAPGKT